MTLFTQGSQADLYSLATVVSRLSTTDLYNFAKSVVVGSSPLEVAKEMHDWAFDYLGEDPPNKRPEIE